MVARLFGALGAIALALLIVPPKLAADQQASLDLEPVTTVEGITEYQLDNGLRVLLFPDRSRPQITVNMTYMVGSRHEGYGETGMAHLLEHMLFMGTPGHPDIMQELTERGAQPNGTTWFDRTNYFEVFPASLDNLDWALDLEADRMINSFVRSDDLESEMTVVRNEMEAGENSPQGILRERTLSTAYLWHNYGKSTIGARSDVENVPIERLRAFYRKYYQPDNAMLVVAGDFEREVALDLILEKYGSIPRPDRTGVNRLYRTYTAEPAQDGERTVTLRRAGEVQYVTTMYHVPPGSHPDYAAIDILSFILGDTPSGRLYKALVETQMATRASSTAYQLREASPLLLSATVDTDHDLLQVLNVINGTAQGIVAEPVTQEEVERAKTALLSGINQSFSSSVSIALQLSEWQSMGDWRLFFLHRDRIEAVTQEDVNRVALSYLKPDNRTVGLFYPTEETDRAELPAVPDIEAMVDGYVGREAIAEGEVFDPTPANVESRTVRYTLNNGIEVALLQKETRGDVALVRVRFHMSDEESLAGRVTAGQIAGTMLMRGTATRTRQDIQDELDRLQSSGGVSGGPVVASGQFQTESQNVGDVIRLLSDIVREPSFPEAEFDIVKEQRLAALDQTRGEPQPLAQRALARHMQNYSSEHPNYTKTLDEAYQSIEATTLEDVRAFYEDFWGPQRANIVIVGDFEEDEVRETIEASFQDWESPHAFARVDAPFYEPPPEEIVIQTPDKANAVFIAQQNLELSDTHQDYPALVLAGDMIGGGFLNSRLARRIRVEEGLSYGAQAYISAHPIDPVGQFIAMAISAPENTEAVEVAFVDEMESILSEGFTEEELRAAKQGWVEQQQLGRASDSSLAGLLSNGLYFQRTLTFDQEFEERVAAVTLEEVNQATQDHLDLAKMTIVKAGDFADN